MRRSLLLLFALALSACSASANLAGGPDLVDDRATAETQALFVNLQRLAPDHLLFGHQDALAYGVDWVREAGRSESGQERIGTVQTSRGT